MVVVRGGEAGTTHPQDIMIESLLGATKLEVRQVPQKAEPSKPPPAGGILKGLFYYYLQAPKVFV